MLASKDNAAICHIHAIQNALLGHCWNIWLFLFICLIQRFFMKVNHACRTFFARIHKRNICVSKLKENYLNLSLKQFRSLKSIVFVRLSLLLYYCW